MLELLLVLVQVGLLVPLYPTKKLSFTASPLLQPELIIPLCNHCLAGALASSLSYSRSSSIILFGVPTTAR